MSDDFFSNVPVRRPARSPRADADTHDDFAQAISLRFGSADLRTARLLPDDLPPHHAHASVHTPALPHQPPPPPRPPPQQSFSSVPPSALAPYLAQPRTLVLDIRPHAAHAAARVNHALSLSVPTTLLKRPLFSLSKLSQMLPSPSSRARFADWSSASCILVYDSDSMSSPDNGIITGLLRKFRAEGFAGELGWIRGGFQAVWRDARDLTTTEQPIQEEDDPETASSFGALRTTHLPKAAFSLFSTTAAPPPQFGAVPVSYPLPNTPAPSVSRAANPFFDAIRQNVELSHGITERIPLRLPRRIRRRIHDLPFRWLQDIARRSALRHSSASRHPGLDTFESGSESSDDPHTSDPDENDPSVEEGTEALAMQFYRIELAEQRRLRSIMEHHTKESEVSAFAFSAKYRRTLDKDGRGVGDGGVTVRTGSKSVPGTPHPTPFPFSITAGVEKGTKNRYTHIWPFEHARVRLHDGRHQGSHPGRRDKGKSSERGRSTRDRLRGEDKEWDERIVEAKQHRSRSSPTLDRLQDQALAERAGPSRHSFSFEVQSSITAGGVGFEAGSSHPVSTPSPSVPRVKIEYDLGDQDTLMSGPSTPATALPLQTPPFYTPMEMPSAFTPMRMWPPQLPPGLTTPEWRDRRSGGTQFTLPASSLPSPGPLPSFQLRLPNRVGNLLPSIGEHASTSESSSIPSGSFAGKVGTGDGPINEAGIKRDPRKEPSPADDYVNASYVQPLGTPKRYIATQGPLPSTYVDFWTLVWEQNVHVIVMLTREVENAMVKCGSYWTDSEYGPLRLELVSTSPLVSPSANSTGVDVSEQGFFAIREPKGKSGGSSREQPTLITRIFALSHTSYPGVPPRKLTHLQYLDWSDMNVPDDPRGVLDLVQRVERAVAESTPGPSPGGSFSPGSGSGSASGSASPDVTLDQKGHGTSLLSPTTAGIMPWGRRRKRGSEWRHPELDSKTGVAAFALGKAPPVLLHCSAGVGRTGGFIAVDAVLDGIRREMRKNMERRKLKKLGAVMNAARMKDLETTGDFHVQNPQVGAKIIETDREERVFESGRMDVDRPTTGSAEKTRDAHRMVNTVPIPVSAGEHTKGGRRHHRGKGSSGEKQSGSSESLVLHVPYVGFEVPEGANVASIDLDNTKAAGWQPYSTREWAEQVSDQTHAHPDDGELPTPPSPRERSPGTTSNSSGPSALNSADDSTNGSVGANVSGSASGSRVGNAVEQKNETDSACGSGIGSGSGGLAPSSVSKLGTGSMSYSNSGSGTGAGSRFGSSLLRTGLRDSSVTSISAESTQSHSPKRETKAGVPFHRPLPIHTSSSSDMEIDPPPRPVSVPPQSVHSSTMNFQRTVHSRHHKAMLGSSPVASISSPILPSGSAQRGSFGGNAAEDTVSRLKDPISNEVTNPPRELESQENADVVGSGENSQIIIDKSDEPAIPEKPESSLGPSTELSSFKEPEVLQGSNFALNLSYPASETMGKERTTVPMACALDDSALRRSPTATPALGAFEHNQPAVDHPVVDYKLPRELHCDLSPPPISSFAEPIFMVIQDMREQRMSLCQSLRQYVFVHAAVIEGALRIVDEEREFWEYGGTSDDASSAEGESRVNVRQEGGRFDDGEGTKMRHGRMHKADVAITMPQSERRNSFHRGHPSKTAVKPSNHWSSESNVGGAQVQITSASSSSGVSSPSKGKRGPSPTELLREDRTGALSSNKRPSIHRKTRSSQGERYSFESTKSSPVAGENGGSSRDAAVDVSGTRVESVVPEKGGPTFSST